jgi:hypothetical protein
MPGSVLTIGHGNGRNDQSLVRMVVESRADSFGCDEAQMLVDELRRIPQTRLTVAGEDWSEDRNRARATSIVTASRNANLGELVRLASHRVPRALRVAPDRPLVCSMYEHPIAEETGHDGVAHFELHANASVRTKPDDAPVVEEYRDSLDTARRWMRSARTDGLLLVLTGDLQVGADFNRSWGPRPQLAVPLGLSPATAGIDWIMVDRALEFAGSLSAQRLKDHDGFTARLLASGLSST